MPSEIYVDKIMDQTGTSSVVERSGSNWTINQDCVKTALNASGDAPIYACRAWVNFNGRDTLAVRSSGNVSSVTDRGQGRYTVNFSSSLPDIDYVFTGYCNEGDGYSGDIVSIDGARSARSVNACPIRLWEISNSNPYDSFEYMCQFVR